MGDVMDIVERLKKRTERRWCGEVQGAEDFPDDDCHEAAAEINRLRTRLYEAEKVIKPFADEVDCYTPIIPDHYVTSVTLGDLRAAAKWMEAKQ